MNYDFILKGFPINAVLLLGILCIWGTYGYHVRKLRARIRRLEKCAQESETRIQELGALVQDIGKFKCVYDKYHGTGSFRLLVSETNRALMKRYRVGWDKLSLLLDKGIDFVKECEGDLKKQWRSQDLKEAHLIWTVRKRYLKKFEGEVEKLFSPPWLCDKERSHYKELYQTFKRHMRKTEKDIWEYFHGEDSFEHNIYKNSPKDKNKDEENSDQLDQILSSII